MNTIVLMCCHNGSKFLMDQIDSILKQTCPVSEICIHDFGSTDGTYEIINKVNQINRDLFNIKRHEDVPGASLSFFQAISILAKRIKDDDCVFFVDQDDVWLPHKVELMLNEFKRIFASSASGQIAIFHDVKVVDQNLVELKPTYYTGDPFLIPRDLNPERLLLANPIVGNSMAISGRLLRKIATISNPSDYIMHDWAAALFASHLGSISFVPVVLSLYRQHSANLIGSYGRDRSFNILGKICKLFRLSKKTGRQALAFAQHLDESFENNTLLKHLAKSSKAKGYALLSISAFRKGPTYKRKMLGLFIGWHSIAYVLIRRN